MKEKVLSEILSEDNDVVDVGIDALKKGIFKDHPYSMRSLGNKDTVKKITIADVRSFYEKIFVSKNTVICIVGDIDIDETIEKVKMGFGNIEKKKFDIDIIEAKQSPLIKKGSIEIKMNKEESAFFIGFNGVSFENNEKYDLEMLFSIMSGSGGRLFNQIREREAVAYSQGGVSTEGIDPGFCFFYVLSSAQTLQKAKEILLNEIKKVIKKGVSEKELQSAKNKLKLYNSLALQINSSRLSRMLSDELYGLGYNDHLEYNKYIDDITINDVLKVSRKFLSLDRSYSVTVLTGEE